MMASKRGLRRRGCESKIRYTTVEEAQLGARRGTHVYRCPFGKHYHVGHPVHSGNHSRAHIARQRGAA